MREANVRTRLEAGHRGLIHALKVNEQVCVGREGRVPVSLLYLVQKYKNTYAVHSERCGKGDLVERSP